MSKFCWGKVIERFDYDFDGKGMEVVKYHPNTTHEGVDMTKVLYHCDEIHESCENLFNLVIAYIAHTTLGMSQHALVTGIAKSLECHG